MSDVCQKHSGMEEKLKAHTKDIVEIKATNLEQWKKLDDHSLFTKDWSKISDNEEKINTHGEVIAGMKRDLRIIMIIGILILTAVIKLAFWPA